MEGELDVSRDLGFVFASRDSFDCQFDNNYVEAHEFFKNNLSMINDVGTLLGDVEGGRASRIKFSIGGVRGDVESFVRECGITVGNFLNAVFAYTYSRFVGSGNVYYTFTFLS